MSLFPILSLLLMLAGRVWRWHCPSHPLGIILPCHVACRSSLSLPFSSSSVKAVTLTGRICYKSFLMSIQCFSEFYIYVTSISGYLCVRTWEGLSILCVQRFPSSRLSKKINVHFFISISFLFLFFAASSHHSFPLLFCHMAVRTSCWWRWRLLWSTCDDHGNGLTIGNWVYQGAFPYFTLLLIHVHVYEVERISAHWEDNWRVVQVHFHHFPGHKWTKENI